jgi:hypothetical protein
MLQLIHLIATMKRKIGLRPASVFFHSAMRCPARAHLASLTSSDAPWAITRNLLGLNCVSHSAMLSSGNPMLGNLPPIAPNHPTTTAPSSTPTIPLTGSYFPGIHLILGFLHNYYLPLLVGATSVVPDTAFIPG